MKKIMVVEDDDAIREALKTFLELAGYSVTTVGNSEKMIEETIQVLPDMVLIDFLLSGKDGCTLVRELRARKDIQRTPVIMVSAYPNASKRAKECGANAFLSKPFDMNELLERMNRLFI